MLRVTARLMQRVKATTGFTALPVVPNYKPVLLDLYSQTLEQLEKFPATVR